MDDVGEASAAVREERLDTAPPRPFARGLSLLARRGDSVLHRFEVLRQGSRAGPVPEGESRSIPCGKAEAPHHPARRLPAVVRLASKIGLRPTFSLPATSQNS